MKRLIFLCMLSVSCNGNPSQVNIAEEVQAYETSTDPNPIILEGIQDKINGAFIQAIMVHNDDALLGLAKGLEIFYNQKNNNLIQYWRAYLQLYVSIYNLKEGDMKIAERAVDLGIDWLKEMSTKNSEDYALLSMLQGYALQFKGMKVMFLAGEVKSNAQKAIAIDSTNLRGYYTYASNDFYTPEKYGGGKDTEKYLLKAIELPEQSVSNAFLPSWGKLESYEMLIKLYIKREEWELAKKFFHEASKLYPDSYQLSQLAAKLVGR